MRAARCVYEPEDGIAATSPQPRPPRSWHGSDFTLSRGRVTRPHGAPLELCPPPRGFTSILCSKPRGSDSDHNRSKKHRGSCPGALTPIPGTSPRSAPSIMGKRSRSCGHQVAEETAAKRSSLRGCPCSGRLLRASVCPASARGRCAELLGKGVDFGSATVVLGGGSGPSRGYAERDTVTAGCSPLPILGTTWARSPLSQPPSSPGMSPQVPRALAQPGQLLVRSTLSPRAGRSRPHTRSPPLSPPCTPVSHPVCLVTARGRPSWARRSAARMPPAPDLDHLASQQYAAELRDELFLLIWRHEEHAPPASRPPGPGERGRRCWMSPPCPPGPAVNRAWRAALPAVYIVFNSCWMIWM